jgi:hypothetical protein
MLFAEQCRVIFTRADGLKIGKSTQRWNGDDNLNRAEQAGFQ